MWAVTGAAGAAALAAGAAALAAGAAAEEARRGAATETKMQEFRQSFEKLHGFKIKSVWAAIEAAGAALAAGAAAFAAGAAAEEARRGAVPRSTPQESFSG